MPYSTRDYARGYSSRYLFPPGVKWLLITNTAMFVLYSFTYGTFLGRLLSSFALVPAKVVERFAIWELVTYLFIHGGVFHILFNMLALWMFGKDLEIAWGTRRFLKFYFLCGIGAGLCVILANYLFGNPLVATIGASGAIYGLLLAFGIMYPEAIVLMIVFPVKAKYFVMIVGAIEFYSSLGASTGVSNIAHLGGMLFGYVYLKYELLRGTRRGSGFDPVGTLRGRYKQWQVERARRKFQVYMRKQGGGPWTN